jgi:protease-4
MPTLPRPNARSIGSPIFRVLCVLLGSLSATGCSPGSFLITPVSGSRALQEHVVARESIWADRKIVLLDVDGVLTNARQSSLFGGDSDNPVARFKEKLDRAAQDSHVDAVVLRINSPGGGVTASDLMHAELKNFRQRSGKPIIACMLDTAASGGYYIACAADRIYAHPTTVTGSIGVIMITPDLSGLMSRVGVQANVIKSGEMKDAGSPFRAMREQDRQLYQNLINSMYERFLDVVAAARTNLTRERIRELADGRVYLAPDAREKGLIDEIGTLNDAIGAAKAAAKLGQRPVMLVQYAPALAYRQNVYAEAPAAPSQVNLINVELPRWLNGASPEFLYLWTPGW